MSTRATRIPRATSGHRLGEQRHRSKYPDATVARARAMRERGMTYTAIGAALGVPCGTVADWVNYATRYA